MSNGISLRTERHGLPDSTHDFAVPMFTPFEFGTYGEEWQEMYDNQPVCQFFVCIEVK